MGLAPTPAILENLHCTHPITLYHSTMAADEWLLELDRNAEASARAREEARRRQDAQEDAEAISDGDDSCFSCTNSSDEMSVVIDDDRPLAEYGPSIDELEDFTRDQALKLGASSTAKQYGRKMEEYRDFAGAVFQDEAVTVDRVIRFLQFQAHRETRNMGDDPPELSAEAIEAAKSKKRKRRVKKGNGTKVSKYKFNVEQYKKVMDHIQNDIKGKDVKDWQSWNRLQSIEKYYSALLWGSSNEMAKEIQACRSIKTLVQNVNKRTKMAKVDNNEEDLNRITEKFQYPKLYRKAEQWLWDEYKTGTNWKYLARSLRDRYTFLMSTQTCTRHEATLSCMLQGFEVADVDAPNELETYWILTRNIYKGKTNQALSRTVLQAKSVRHKDPKLCEQGALAMYLFARFHVHDEDFDLLDKSNDWMKIKTTVPLNNSRKQFMNSRKKSMSEGSYYTKMECCFRHFGYNVSHVIHFGRSCTPVLLEFAEVLVEYIKMLGEWDKKTYEKSYSTGIPFQAVRVAAGFPKDVGFFRIPRSHLAVPTELKRKVFPNVERARQLFMAVPESERYTRNMATKFLRVMDYLSQVFIQDVCALRYEGREDHMLYTHPLFFDHDFVKYETEFREKYSIALDPINDPTLDPIKKAAPMMAHHLGNLSSFTHQGFKLQHQEMNALRTQQHHFFQAMQSHVAAQTQISQQCWNVIGSALQAGYQAHLSSPLNKGQGFSAITPSPQVAAAADTTANATDARTAASLPLATTDSPLATNGIPVFDRLAYDSVELIYEDWFGEGDNEYREHGGVRALYTNKQFRKNLGADKKKRESDKKMLQKMQHIGKYMEELQKEGLTKNEIVQRIHDEVLGPTKSKPTLTGIDKALTAHKNNNK